MTYFHEEQRFRESWLWLIVLIPLVVAVKATLGEPRTPVATILTVAVGIGVALLIGLARLETTVTGEAVVVAFHGLWPTRRIGLADIAVGCMLGYLDLRLPESGWRARHANLVAFAERMFARPSFAATLPETQHITEVH